MSVEMPSTGQGLAEVLQVAVGCSAPEEVISKLLHSCSNNDSAGGSSSGNREDGGTRVSNGSITLGPVDVDHTLNRTVDAEATAVAATAMRLDRLLATGPTVDVTEVLKAVHVAHERGLLLHPICQRPAGTPSRQVFLIPLHAALLARCPLAVIQELLELQPGAAQQPIPWAVLPVPEVGASLQLPQTRSGPPLATPQLQICLAASTSDGTARPVPRVTDKQYSVPHWLWPWQRSPSPSDAAIDSAIGGLKPLHYAVLRAGPRPLLETLLVAHPAAAAETFPLPWDGRADQRSSQQGTVLQVLLYNRAMYDEELLLMTLRESKELASLPDAWGFSPIVLALLADSHDACSKDLIVELAGADRTTFKRVLADLGLPPPPDGDDGDQTMITASLHDALEIVSEARCALKQVLAGPWAASGILPCLTRRPQIAGFLLDGEFLVWWALLHRAPSNVLLGILEACPGAVDVSRESSVDVLHLALLSRHGLAVVSRLTQLGQRIRDTMHLPSDFAKLQRLTTLHKFTREEMDRMQALRIKGGTVLNLGIACDAPEDVLHHLLDICPSLAKADSAISTDVGNTPLAQLPLLQALQRSDLSQHFWQRLCDMNPPAQAVVVRMLQDKSGKEQGISTDAKAAFLASAKCSPWKTLHASEVGRAVEGSIALEREILLGPRARAEVVTRLLRSYGKHVLTIPGGCQAGMLSMKARQRMTSELKRLYEQADGQLLPLHLAAFLGCHAPVILTLLHAWPEAASKALRVSGYHFCPWRELHGRGPTKVFLLDVLVFRCSSPSISQSTSDSDDLEVADVRERLKLVRSAHDDYVLGSQKAVHTKTDELRNLVSATMEVLDIYPQAATCQGRTGILHHLLKQSDGTWAALAPLWRRLLAIAPGEAGKAESGERTLLRIVMSDLSILLKLDGQSLVELIQSQLSSETAGSKEQLVRQFLRCVYEGVGDHGFYEYSMASHHGKDRRKQQVVSRLLLPERSWAEERLVWAGHLLCPDSPFCRLPKGLVKKVSDYLGRESICHLLLSSLYPILPDVSRHHSCHGHGDSDSNEADSNEDVLALVVLQLLLGDVTHPFDPATIRWVLQKNMKAAQVPLPVCEEVRTREGVHGRREKRMHIVLPFSALLLNRATFAPDLTTWVLRLFPAAACCEDALGRLPLAMLVQKPDLPWSHMQGLISELIQRTPPLPISASEQSNTKVPPEMLCSGSVVQEGTGRTGHLLSGPVAPSFAKTVSALPNNGSPTPDQISYLLVALSPPRPQQRRPPRPHPHVGTEHSLVHLMQRMEAPNTLQEIHRQEARWLRSDQIIRLQKSPPGARHGVRASSLASCLMNPRLPLSILSSVLELRPGEIVPKVTNVDSASSDADGAASALEVMLLRLRRPGHFVPDDLCADDDQATVDASLATEAVATMVPRMVQLCPAVAFWGVSAQTSSEELGCASGHRAVPLMLALQRHCPESALLALAQLNPHCQVVMMPATATMEEAVSAVKATGAARGSVGMCKDGENKNTDGAQCAITAGGGEAGPAEHQGRKGRGEGVAEIGDAPRDRLDPRLTGNAIGANGLPNPFPLHSATSVADNRPEDVLAYRAYQVAREYDLEDRGVTSGLSPDYLYDDGNEYLSSGGDSGRYS